MERTTISFVAAIAGSLLLSGCATTEPVDEATLSERQQEMQEARSDLDNTYYRRVMDQRDLRNQSSRVGAADAERAAQLNVDP